MDGLTGFTGTVIMMDIDGVVGPIPLPSDGPGYNWPDESEVFWGGSVGVMPHVMEFLRSVDRRDLVWCSSWGDMSTDLGEEMGVDFANCMEYGSSKRDMVESFLRDNPGVDRIVICDDRRYIVKPDGVTVDRIVPNKYIGLTPGNITRLNNILSSQ